MLSPSVGHVPLVGLLPTLICPTDDSTEKVEVTVCPEAILARYTGIIGEMRSYLSTQYKRLEAEFGEDFERAEDDDVSISKWVPFGRKTPCYVELDFYTLEKCLVSIHLGKALDQRRLVYLEVKFPELTRLVDLLIARDLTTLVKIFFENLPGLLDLET